MCRPEHGRTVTETERWRLDCKLAEGGVRVLPEPSRYPGNESERGGEASCLRVTGSLQSEPFSGLGDRLGAGEPHWKQVRGGGVHTRRCTEPLTPTWGPSATPVLPPGYAPLCRACLPEQLTHGQAQGRLPFPRWRPSPWSPGWTRDARGGSERHAFSDWSETVTLFAHLSHSWVTCLCNLPVLQPAHTPPPPLTATIVLRAPRSQPSARGSLMPQLHLFARHLISCPARTSVPEGTVFALTHRGVPAPRTVSGNASSPGDVCWMN